MKGVPFFNERCAREVSVLSKWRTKGQWLDLVPHPVLLNHSTVPTDLRRTSRPHEIMTSEHVTGFTGVAHTRIKSGTHGELTSYPELRLRNGPKI